MRTVMRRFVVPALLLGLTVIPTAAQAVEGTATQEATADTARDWYNDRLDAFKQRALALLDAQQDALRRLSTGIANSDAITDDHAAQLTSDIGETMDTLEELVAEVEAATTFAQVEAAIRAAHALHIGQVLAPKTYQVVASDTIVAVATGKFQRFTDKLERLITRAEEAGYDVDEAWRLLDEMQGQIDEAVRLADPVAESVIGLQPEDWPTPAKATLAAGRSALHEARESLRDAFATGKDIVQFLRSLLEDEATDA